MHNLLAPLKKMLGSENFFEDRASIIALSSFPGQTKDEPLPLAALYPRHDGHLRDILNFCREHTLSLRIMGGGTSGLRQKPREKELLLLTGGLNRILSLEKENRLLIAQSGLSLAALEKHLASTKLFLPFHISKTSPATLGGLIAANMPGLYSLGYGCPGIFVKELELFFSSGEKKLMSCQNDQPLDPAFPLASLFIGSQGRLGLISAIKMRLLPRPSAQQSFVIPCANNTEAVAASSLVLNSDLNPAALEILSADAAQVCTAFNQPCLYLSFSGMLPCLEVQKASLCHLFDFAKPSLLTEEENESFLSAYSVWIIKLQSQNAFSLPMRCVCPQDKLSYFMEIVEESLNENKIKAAFAIHAGLSYIHLLLFGPSPERLREAEKMIFTTELMLNNRMSSEKDAELSPDEWRNFHDEHIHLSRKLAEMFDPYKIFSASLF